MPWAAQFSRQNCTHFHHKHQLQPLQKLSWFVFFFPFLFASGKKRGDLFSQILNSINESFTISLIELLLLTCHEVICLSQVWGKAKIRLFQNKISNKNFLQLPIRFSFSFPQTICFLLWLSSEVFSYSNFFFFFVVMVITLLDARSTKNCTSISFK